MLYSHLYLKVGNFSYLEYKCIGYGKNIYLDFIFDIWLF